MKPVFIKRHQAEFSIKGIRPVLRATLARGINALSFLRRQHQESYNKPQLHPIAMRLGLMNIALLFLEKRFISD